MPRLLRPWSVALFLAALVAGLSGCAPEGARRPLDTVIFGDLHTGESGLVYIAMEKGFFTKNGISVVTKEYSTGGKTINAALKDEIDIASTTEFPVARSALGKEKIDILAITQRFDIGFLYARNDRVESISDLKGRKIGVMRSTVFEYYLVQLLLQNGLGMKDVSILDVQPEQMLSAIAGGIVDAVVIWEPFGQLIKTQLLDKISVWPLGDQRGFVVIACTTDWIRDHRDILNRFLKSLDQAEDLIMRDPKTAIAIIRNRMNFNESTMNMYWPSVEYSFSLDQSLVLAMEDEARWLIKNRLANNSVVPNYLDYIDENALRAINPEAARIIGK